MNVTVTQALLLFTLTCVIAAILVDLWVRSKPHQPEDISYEVVDRWRSLASGLRELAGENMVGLRKLQQHLEKLPSGVAREYLARIVADVGQLIDDSQHVERALGTVQSALQQVVNKSTSTPVLVRHLMSQPVQTVPATLSAALAAKRLVDYRIRHLPVVDQDGSLIGIVSDRNILKHLSPWLSRAQSTSASSPLPKRLRVNDIMSSTTITVRGETTLAEAAGLMASKRINCLPVVENDQQLVGILTTMDVLLHVASSRKRV
jgi:acetoin utilization protein AcuB